MLITKLVNLFNFYRKAEITKIFSLTAISTLVKMLAGFISIKVVAVIVGPSGIALLGQLSNFSIIIMTLASGGINNGVTKYIAENKNYPRKIQLFLSTALQITLVLSLVSGICLIIFSSLLSDLILTEIKYSYVFILFGVTLILYALNKLLMSIINGYKEFNKFVNISIVTSVVGVIFTVGLVWIWKLPGALVSAVTYQSIVFFITVRMVIKSKWFVLENFNSFFSGTVFKKYLSYSMMAFVTAATVPVAQLIIRGYVITNISTSDAGLWEAMNRISGMYLLVITSSFGVYYLPRLSEIKDNQELRKEIFTAYKIILPLITLGFLIIYIFRDLIIQILFTQEFSPMRDLFAWQLIGDFFKISCWLLAFLMVARAMTKLYIFTEIFFSTLFVTLSIVLINKFQIVGIPMAYMINYLISLIFMVVVFREIIFQNSIDQS